LWSTKRLQQQIVAIVEKVPPEDTGLFYTWVWSNSSPRYFLPAAWEAEMKFINGFPISTHLSGPISYVLHLSILAYLFLLIPQGERVYSIY
jgi:hypothetical protein